MHRIVSTLRAIGWRNALADALTIFLMAGTWWLAVVITWTLA